MPNRRDFASGSGFRTVRVPPPPTPNGDETESTRTAPGNPCPEIALSTIAAGAAWSAHKSGHSNTRGRGPPRYPGALVERAQPAAEGGLVLQQRTGDNVAQSDGVKRRSAHILDRLRFVCRRIACTRGGGRRWGDKGLGCRTDNGDCIMVCAPPRAQSPGSRGVACPPTSSMCSAAHGREIVHAVHRLLPVTLPAPFLHFHQRTPLMNAHHTAPAAMCARVRERPPSSEHLVSIEGNARGNSDHRVDVLRVLLEHLEHRLQPSPCIAAGRTPSCLRSRVRARIAALEGLCVPCPNQW